MMTIVFDVSPETLDLSNAVMRRRLGKDAADYLTSLTDELRAEHLAHEMSPEFSVQITYGLANSSASSSIWIVKRLGQDPDFIEKCRSKHADRLHRARSANA